jgi:hypothetical protein
MRVLSPINAFTGKVKRHLKCPITDYTGVRIVIGSRVASRREGHFVNARHHRIGINLVRSSARFMGTIVLLVAALNSAEEREVVRQRYGNDLPFYWGAFVLVGR